MGIGKNVLMVALLGVMCFPAYALRVGVSGTLEVHGGEQSQESDADDDEQESSGKSDKLFSVGKRSVSKGEYIEGRCKNGGKFKLVSFGSDIWTWKGPKGSGESKVDLNEGSINLAFIACGEEFKPFQPASSSTVSFSPKNPKMEVGQRFQR